MSDAITFPEPLSLKKTEKIIEQMKNCICRINDKGTGFFVKIPYKSKLLPTIITTNYVINSYDIQNDKNISLYLNNNKTIKIIKLDNNRLKYTNEKLDVTIIEIKEKEDNLNIKYLELDDEIINYFKINGIKDPKNSNNFYYNESIYLLNYLKKKDIYVSFGKLLDINETQIFHKYSIKEESSGSPILLMKNQKLIGIHCCKHLKYNIGTLLIYSIIEFSRIKNNLLIKNANSIFGELEIKEDNQNIRIINSYEQSNREEKFEEYKKENENEKEIIENCEIRINDKLIPFSYFHKFNKKGKYTILYIFKKKITKTIFMFNFCKSLTKINLSNFNTDNVKNMSCMFWGCSSLTNINLSNLNTFHVTNMSSMFGHCASLIKINLSNFNTDNVKDMSSMFFGCKSLSNINLSIFNTENVINMSGMFWNCSSLTNINLSNFNTNNVKDMSWMFSWCSSLTNINLSNFNTDNVNKMGNMFNECSSLTNINLSNFNTNNVKDMNFMFAKCSSLTNVNLSNFNTNNVNDLLGMFSECTNLTKNNIITKDKKLLSDLNKLFI